MNLKISDSQRVGNEIGTGVQKLLLMVSKVFYFNNV